MNIEIEELKIKLIETQMTVLQYQHHEASEKIKQLNLIKSQKTFDDAVDERDMPSGASS